MTIGNSLATELANRAFSRTADKISDLQGLIASGKNDPRASADQMRAAQLSALREQRAAMDHFTNAAEQAASRVALSDQAIGDAATLMRRLSELAIQAGNDTLPDEGMQGIQVEAETLRSALVEIANRVDALGQPLFAGYSPAPAYEETATGVRYLGDGGRPSQRLSETLTLPVGLNGAELFGATPSGDGKMDVFQIVDELIDSFGVEMHNSRSEVAITGRAEVHLTGGRDARTVSMTLGGPLGSVDLDLDVVAGMTATVVDQINAHTAATGITASLTADGKGFELNAEGEITIEGLSRDDNPTAHIGTIQQLEFRGEPGKPMLRLKTEAMSATAMLEQVQDALAHFATKRAEVGAMGSTVDAQKEAIDVRRLNIDTAVAGLEDLDVAAAITRLETLLLNRDAAQQTYVQITRTSLFDYLR
mgnify:CR=1 FL=1